MLYMIHSTCVSLFPPRFENTYINEYYYQIIQWANENQTSTRKTSVERPPRLQITHPPGMQFNGRPSLPPNTTLAPTPNQQSRMENFRSCLKTYKRYDERLIYKSMNSPLRIPSSRKISWEVSKNTNSLATGLVSQATLKINLSRRF
jgi:hypothetical protein